MIDFDDAQVFGIPLIDQIDGSVVREGMLIEGPQGWGEFSPPIDCADDGLARWLTSAIEGGTVGWPDPLRGRVPIAVVVPAVNPARAHEIVANSGCHTADVTIAGGPGTLADDLARVEAVRDALGADGAIRCDVGGGWTVDAAVAAIADLAAAARGLEFVTQPCGTLAELTALRLRVDVRIAVDLSMPMPMEKRSLVDVADLAVLRCGPLGGVRRAMRLAETSGLPCVVSSSWETSIGLASGLALAGVLPELPFACGLGTASSLAGDLVSEERALLPVDGYLPVAPTPASPQGRLVERYALTDPGRIAWWRARLAVARAR
jgi:O-succinylbenzoate synthase